VAEQGTGRPQAAAPGEPSAIDDLFQDDQPSGKKPRRALRTWLIVLGSLVVALIVAVGALVGWGIGQLNAVKREPGLLPSGRVTVNPGDLISKPLNFLLLGSDSRGADRGRSDVMILVHADADRGKLYLISLPRDLWVTIPGHKLKNKINAAYAFGGAALSVQTVETLLNVRIDNVALTDFEGFFNLIDDLGGVRVFNDIPSANGGFTFPRGDLDLTGASALAYVRERYDLPRGDFDRAERQRLVIKGIVDKLASNQTLTNPGKLLAVINRLSKSVTVDDTLTNANILALVNDLQLTSGDDIEQFQVPIAGFGTSSAGASYVKPDDKRMAQLAEALSTGRMSSYQP